MSLSKVCITNLYTLILYIATRSGDLPAKQHRTPIYFRKRALRIIPGVQPRSPSEALFYQLKILNCENIFKYQVSRLMYRVYHRELTTLQFRSKNTDIHLHDARQRGHYHIPLCRTNLGKSSLRYFGAVLSNKVLNADFNTDVSGLIFSRNVKTVICNNSLEVKCIWQGAHEFNRISSSLCSHNMG